MVQAILEHEVLVGVFGLVVAGLMGYTGLQIGQSKLMIAALAIAAATIALVVTSFQIDTDREQIQRSMEEIATALRANDYEKVFTYLHPNASEGIYHAKSEIPNYKFSRASISNVREIRINERTDPMTAISDFVALFSVSSEKGRQLYDADVNVLRNVKVYWMKSGDRWLIRDYRHSELNSPMIGEN